MKILLFYLKKHWPLLILALVLAAVNQCFSLMDPYIAGKILNKFGSQLKDAKIDRTLSVFFNQIIFLLLASMGVAMVSRIAKNFQDYFTNVVIQRSGAQMYTDGIRHSLELPYQDFEDQRSGETLGQIQKMRSDSEKFITSFVNIVFQSSIGIIFVVVYAVQLNWMIAPLFLLTAPLLGSVSSLLSKKIKKVSKTILKETTALAGATTESLRINSGGERNVQIAEVIQKMLKENLNIDIDINVMPMAEHMENFETGKAIFWRTGWIADYPDPESFLTILYGKHVPEHLSERSYINSVRYKSAKFDSLFELALREVDTKKRFDLYRQADQVAIDDAAIMPIFYHENYRLVQLWVKNCEANAMEYRDMSRVYFIPKDEIKKK